MGASGGKSCCGEREGRVSGPGKEDDGADEARGVGERSRNSKFSTHHQDQSMESSSNEREECIYIPL